MWKQLLCLFVFLTINLNLDSSWADSSTKIMVVPFENRDQKNKAQQKSKHYLTLALPIAIAEKLEKSTSFKMVNGRIPIMTSEQAQLMHENGTTQLDEAVALAREKGATHFITGYFSGSEWNWSVTVEIYTVSTDQYTLVSSGTARGDQTIDFITRSGRKTKIVGAEKLYEIFAEASFKAFDSAKLPLSVDEKKALAKPPSRDSYANILLNRAYIKYLNQTEKESEGSNSKNTPLEIAEHAVRVDPSSNAAQRFYALLLEENNKPKKARSHYETAIKLDQTDARSLLRLGNIEMAEKNFSVAETVFQTATKLTSNDALVYFNLGLAQLALNEIGEAITSLENARDLDPSDMITRRQLAELYAGEKNYQAAATEFEIISINLPNNKEVAFLLGACLRADKDYEKAISAYSKAAERFLDDNRFLKFKGNVFLKIGDIAQALDSYTQALQVHPQDEQLLAMGLGTAEIEKIKTYIGGEELIKVITSIAADFILAEDLRSKYQETANDTIISFTTSKSKNCTNPGVSSYLLTQKLSRQYVDLNKYIDKRIEATILAFKLDGWAYLTPDEALVANKNLEEQKLHHHDLNEISAQNRVALMPLLHKNECSDLSGFTAGHYDDVVFRNQNQLVELPVVKPPKYLMAITPQIPPVTARVVRCTVDNTLGQKGYTLMIDGQTVSYVSPGKIRDFTAKVGRHRLCLLPKGENCDSENERDVFIYENWTLTIKN
ncbi:MAG: tetratricopeptide repeat protein [bacterium]|nr:tetratricopeptide repeat protein [bacterium]